MIEFNFWIWVVIFVAIGIYLVAEGYVWWRAFYRKNRPVDTRWHLSWFIYPPLTIAILFWMLNQTN